MIDDTSLFLTNLFGLVLIAILGTAIVQGFTMNEISTGEMAFGLILCGIAASIPIYYFYMWAKEK